MTGPVDSRGGHRTSAAVPGPEPDWSVGARAVLCQMRALRGGGRWVTVARALDGVERRELLRCLVEAAAALLCARWEAPAPVDAVPTWLGGRSSDGRHFDGDLLDGRAPDGEPLERRRIEWRRNERSHDGRWCGEPPWVEQPWIERVLVRSSGGQGWRARARTCLWMCLARGADDEALELLASLVDRHRRAWPEASVVLEGARLVHSGPVVAHLHATALELEGRLDAARRVYTGELDREDGRRQVPRAFEGLARVHRRAGRPRAALAAAATDWHPVSLAAAARDARILHRDHEAKCWTECVESALRDACGRRSARIAAALGRALPFDEETRRNGEAEHHWSGRGGRALETHGDVSEHGQPEHRRHARDHQSLEAGHDGGGGGLQGRSLGEVEGDIEGDIERGDDRRGDGGGYGE